MVDLAGGIFKTKPVKYDGRQYLFHTIYKDKFAISDTSYHEISMVLDISSL